MFFRRQSQPSGSGWQPMSSAPRDGTIVELVCTYGVAPWYGLHKWTGERSIPDQNGDVHTFTSEPTWVDASDPSKSVSDEQFLQWRPASSDQSNYTDPTRGEQYTAEYWQRAAGLF